MNDTFSIDKEIITTNDDLKDATSNQSNIYEAINNLNDNNENFNFETYSFPKSTNENQITTLETKDEEEQKNLDTINRLISKLEDISAIRNQDYQNQKDTPKDSKYQIPDTQIDTEDYNVEGYNIKDYTNKNYDLENNNINNNNIENNDIPNNYFEYIDISNNSTNINDTNINTQNHNPNNFQNTINDINQNYIDQKIPDNQNINENNYFETNTQQDNAPYNTSNLKNDTPTENDIFSTHYSDLLNVNFNTPNSTPTTTTEDIENLTPTTNKSEEIKNINDYWNAANYLSVGQLYLLNNPLLKRPLTKKDIKKKIVGHWGTVPGQNFIYAHLNRIINKYDLNMIYISGPGHGGNAIVSNTYLEGTYSEIYPNITEDEDGLQKLFKQFSFPGGISSHVAPETPGSINEGGELGYSLAHAFGAVFDNPDLIVACTVGDGEAETGPLATSWHSNKFLNPKTDGIVLPILHLNGYKISNPTIFARISHDEIESFFKGCGWKPYFVEDDQEETTTKMHEKMMDTLDQVVKDIKEIKENTKTSKRPIYPMIILKTKKGWTGPKIVDDKEIEDTFRAHQVPISMEKESHIKLLENWMKSYHPEDLFDESGKLKPHLKALVPKKSRRMGSNKIANGGLLLKELRLPDFRKYALNITRPGEKIAQDMLELGAFIRDIFVLNKDQNNFRIFGPDETMSNRLSKVFEEESRAWNANTKENDEFLSPTGKVMDSYLSEHMCEGWLEGYLLTGRHGLFASYEAFIRVVDSMASQHAKWLKVTKQLPWRREIASLNYILTSNVWQQDHNGYTHQDPGFIDHIVNKKADVVRVYLPPDTNCLLSVFNHCIKSKNYINLMITSKHPRPQWLTMDQAIKHCSQGIGIWDWASTDQGEEPDIILACAGDTPTLEALAAVTIMKEYLKEVKIRFINVVDLMKLQSKNIHPHGLSDTEYDLLFTTDKPIIFAYHGYKSLIHELLYYRKNRKLHVHGYMEEGTITTAFDMRVQNEIDRYHLVIDMLYNLPQLKNKRAHLIQMMNDKLIEHNEYIREYGEDLPEIKNWTWE